MADPGLVKFSYCCSLLIKSIENYFLYHHQATLQFLRTSIIELIWIHNMWVMWKGNSIDSDFLCAVFIFSQCYYGCWLRLVSRPVGLRLQSERSSWSRSASQKMVGLNITTEGQGGILGSKLGSTRHGAFLATWLQSWWSRTQPTYPSFHLKKTRRYPSQGSLAPPPSKPIGLLIFPLLRGKVRTYPIHKLGKIVQYIW